MAFLKRSGALLLSLLLSLGLMVLIYCFSAQDGEESGKTSGTITDKVVRVVEPEYDSLPVPQQRVVYEKVSFGVRKTGHFSEYAALGFALAWHLTEWRKRREIKAPGLWAWLLAAVYAMTDEFHQSFVGGRGPSLRDVGIDSLGALAGVLAFSVLLWLLGLLHRRLQRKKPI